VSGRSIKSPSRVKWQEVKKFSGCFYILELARKLASWIDRWLVEWVGVFDSNTAPIYLLLSLQAGKQVSRLVGGEKRPQSYTT
jgi:hypothetical protein